MSTRPMRWLMMSRWLVMEYTGLRSLLDAGSNPTHHHLRDLECKTPWEIWTSVVQIHASVP